MSFVCRGRCVQYGNCVCCRLFRSFAPDSGGRAPGFRHASLGLAAHTSGAAAAPFEGIMTASVGIWKHTPSETEDSSGRKAVRPAPIHVLNSLARGPEFTLMQQIFFAGANVQRTRVLFAAANAETDMSAFSGRMGAALSETSQGMVAIICTPSVSTVGDFSKKRARNHEGAGLWRSYSSQISEQLWRIPAEL